MDATDNIERKSSNAENGCHPAACPKRKGSLGIVKLLMVVNVDWFFLSHRLEIAKAAEEAGWDVHVATALTDSSDELRSHGFTLHPVRIHRSSWNPIGLLMMLMQFVKVFREVRPDVTHLVTIKPVIFGGIAARITQVQGIVYAVSGLGHVFIAEGVLGKIRKSLVQGLYKAAMGSRNKVVIFQNNVDRDELERLGCVTREESALIPGSGFDVDNYEVSPMPTGTPVFLMAARLIRTKGVREFTAAARQLREEGVDADFWLVGSSDHSNPEGLTMSEVGKVEAAGFVSVLGFRKNVPELMRSASVVVLPSYYGEGLPKVLIEAGAAGRAVITTDAPGCRDAIEDGVTGLLVKERDVAGLANAMRQLALHPDLREQMGAQGRRRAEEVFRIQGVVGRHLDIYSSLLVGADERQRSRISPL